MIFAHFPGLMSPDSAAVLTDGRAAEYHALNSPVMAATWGFLDRIWAGPGLMLILQNVVFWLGIGLISNVAGRRSKWLGFAIVLLGLLPHIASQLSTIWKDVELAAVLLVAVGLIACGREYQSKAAIAASSVFLLCASAVRLNAVTAVVPIAIWSVFEAYHLFQRREIGLPLVTGIAYCVMLTAAAYGLNLALTKGRAEYPFQQVELYDLAAISVKAGESRFPDYVVREPTFSLELTARRYNDRSVSDLIYSDLPNAGDRPVLPLSSDPEEIAALDFKWRQAIVSDPVTYLAHRTQVFRQLVGLKWSVTSPFWNVEDENESAAGRVARSYYKLFQRPVMQTFGFRAFLWLLAAIALLMISYGRRFRGDWRLVGVLAASAVFYTFGYFPTTPSSEFRYLFWPAVASAVAIVFGIYLLRNGTKAVSSV